MLGAEQEGDLPQGQEAFPRPGSRHGEHIPTQAGFQIAPCVRAQLPVGHTVREGGGDGAGSEGHHLGHLPQPGLQDSQAAPSPHQGTAVLPHVDTDALGMGQGEGWEQNSTVPPVTATCDTCHLPGVKHAEAGTTVGRSLPEAGERRFQGPRRWSESPAWCPAAGAEQHQPLGKTVRHWQDWEFHSNPPLTLRQSNVGQDKPSLLLEESVFSAQAASGRGAPQQSPAPIPRAVAAASAASS